MAPAERFSLDDFDSIMAINVRAVFVAVQAALPHMKEGGRIITIGSCNADRMPFVGGAPYATSKNPASGPFSETMKGLAALRRYGHDTEIASLVAYPAGDEAGYITGASLTIDGSFSA